MKSKRRPVGVGIVAAVVAMLAMSVGASAAFGYSEFKVNKTFPVAITGEGGQAQLVSGDNVITCEHTASNWKLGSPTSITGSITYSGKCELKGKISGSCTEPIQTEELTVQPGTIGGGSDRGLLFTSSDGVVAKLTCDHISFKVEGELVCESRGFVGKLAAKGEFVCSEKKNEASEPIPGEQMFTTISVTGVEKLKQELTAGGVFTNEKVAEVMTEQLTFEPTGTEIEQS